MYQPNRIRERAASAAPMFHSNDKWTLLSCDADSIIYNVAATTNNIETAKRRFVDKALTLHFLSDAALSRMHLTPKHCRKAGRFNIIAQKPYQANREPGFFEDGTPKPSKKPALVEPLRYAVGRGKLLLPPEIEIVFNDVFEADDSVVTECTTYGDDAIYYSEDKDLDCLRNRKLCQKTLKVLPALPSSLLGTLELVELSASKKVAGRGPLFFWAQMLMGDTADNIKGIIKMHGKLCGPAKTFEELEVFSGADSSREADVARLVLGHYMAIDQNPWPEAWLLWLYPTPSFTFYHYLLSLGVLDDSELGKWLIKKQAEQWFRVPDNE